MQDTRKNHDDNWHIRLANIIFDALDSTSNKPIVISVHTADQKKNAEIVMAILQEKKYEKKPISFILVSRHDWNKYPIGLILPSEEVAKLSAQTPP